MVNKCVVTNCFTGHLNGPKKSCFAFPQDPDLRQRWVYFVNRKDWQPTKNSVICVDHFDEKYVKVGEKRSKLIWDILPVPTKQVDKASSASSLRVPVAPRPPPATRYFGRNDMPDFLLEDKITDLDSLSENDSPPGFSFRREGDTIQYFNLVFDKTSGIPAVHECISVDNSLHVTLSYHGFHVPLPQWFRTGNNCTLHRKSMLENFAPCIRSKGSEMNSILQEISSNQFHKPQGRPQYSASMIRYAMLIRFTSCQAYKIMLEKLPLPSLSLLRKITSGGVDAVKAARFLLEKGCISSDCVLLIDEMYLQKGAEYHGGNLVGQDQDGTLYKGICVFMIVSLKKSIPYVVKCCPEVTINGTWLSAEIDKCIFTLKEAGFNVRAVITDDHGSNVSAFKILHNKYEGDNELFIYHPAYENLKIYLFFDMIHLVKNVRNNLLNNKKFVFPSFEFNLFLDAVKVPQGYVSWHMLHLLYEKDEQLQGNLRKAPKISYKVLHPGNNKQSVPLALAVFDETTSAAIRSYFSDRQDAASFLNLIYKVFVIFNSKGKFNSANKLGNAAVQGDHKPDFFRAVAKWVDEWCTSPHFTLSCQTAHALSTTLRACALLIEDLLQEGYEYVLLARLLTDALERHFSKYRQMSGGRFLVSLLEVSNSERILRLRKLIKEDINFWEEDLEPEIAVDGVITLVEEELAHMHTELLQSELNSDSKEVAVTIGGYVAKKLTKRSKCDVCPSKFISPEKHIDNDKYLSTLSRGGLICPSAELSDFVSHSFSILDMISHILQKFVNQVPVKYLAEKMLSKIQNGVHFTCEKHEDWGRKFAIRTVVNIFYNNERKRLSDYARKDQVKDFKKRQRTK